MNDRMPLSRIMGWGRLAALLLVAAIAVGPPACSAQDPVDVEMEAGAHDEHAGDAESPPLLNVDFGSAVWNLLIFLAVLFILGKFVWPQILAGLQARENKIHSDLAAAERANQQAKTLLSDYQKQLGDAQGEIQQMLAEARRDAERVGAQIVADAKADADRQRQRALADIETAKSVAISQVAEQASEIAISLARQVVGRELNPHDHADLISQSLQRIPSRN